MRFSLQQMMDSEQGNKRRRQTEKAREMKRLKGEDLDQRQPIQHLALLELPASCRRALFSLLKQVVTLFSKLGIKYCVAYGTLLGYVRERSLLAHDDDADLFTEQGACARVKASKNELRKHRLVLWEDPIWPGHFSLIRRKNQLQQWPFVECFTLLKSGHPEKTPPQAAAERSAAGNNLSINVDLTKCVRGTLELPGCRSFEILVPLDPEGIADTLWPGWKTEVTGITYHRYGRDKIVVDRVGDGAVFNLSTGLLRQCPFAQLSICIAR